MRVALLLFALLLTGCGAAPNTSATQTRTSEIVDMTVAARVSAAATAIPTATPQPPPAATNTPIPPPPAPSPAAQPTPRYSQHSLFFDSWVAYSSVIGVRFFAPPSLVEEAGRGHGPDYFALYSPSDTYDFEGLTVYRIRNRRGGDTPATWKGELDASLRGLNAIHYSVTSGPSPQRIGDFIGQRGQFNYEQPSNNLRVSGTLWVGQVGADVLEILYRCDPTREYWLDREMMQIMDTIDFNAR